MAESVENLSSEESENSDFDDVSSVASSTSSASSSEEEVISNRAKGKLPAAVAKKNKTTKGNASTAKTTRPRKKKKADNSLNVNEMEDLSTWICSLEEVSKVEQHLRLNLVSDARIKGDRKRFVEHLLCDTEMQNFRLLMTGFCRKFSTQAEEAYNSSIATYRKAAFSIAWMKFLSNFQPGRTTQERMIVERLLRSSNEQFDAHCVHSVLSVIHESVYSVIHDHARIKKAETESTGTCQTTTELHEESEDTLYRYCGASLHRMIKLREETLAQKKGRGELSDERKPIMEKELRIFRELVMKDKSSITESLKTLDEGNLKFPRIQLLPF